MYSLGLWVALDLEDWSNGSHQCSFQTRIDGLIWFSSVLLMLGLVLMKLGFHYSIEQDAWSV